MSSVPFEKPAFRYIDGTDPAQVAERLWQGFHRSLIGFDIGANAGQSIPQMLEICNRVVSFEPNQDSFAEMNRRWGGDEHTDVELHRIAISDHDGQVQLAQLGGKQAETGQLVTPGLRGMEWDPGNWGDVARVNCLAMTLDSAALVYGRPGFVKVDTEGHEVMVLVGARTVLSKGANWLIEFHSPENHRMCQAILHDSGHKTETIRHPHYAETSPMWHQHGWIKAWR